MVGLQIFAKPRRPVPDASSAAATHADTQAAGGACQGSSGKEVVKQGSRVTVSFALGKWAGRHEVEVLSRTALRDGSARKTAGLSAEQELLQLQGKWQTTPMAGSSGGGQSASPSVSLFVRGKRVEESYADGSRQFFNLVLAEKAKGPETGAGGVKVKNNGKGKAKEGGKSNGKGKSFGKQKGITLCKRHALPPLKGPAPGNGKGKGGKGKRKGKEAVNAVGHWVLLHHTPKLLLWRPTDGAEPLWWHPKEQASWTRGGPVLEVLEIRYLKDSHVEELRRHRDDLPGVWRARKGFAVEISVGSHDSAPKPDPQGPAPQQGARKRKHDLA
eukprot:TRINITY_DN53607_c0_g1_i1.p1 TRINITY_DN53607_c0_g1~~TRINITY_DN53607_c0_g1_i1.p1  ORF type:complete len:329 (-),score=73.51 TRINITY_DN53607_c0_g1_i1:11-997(-)